MSEHAARGYVGQAVELRERLPGNVERFFPLLRAAVVLGEAMVVLGGSRPITACPPRRGW